MDVQVDTLPTGLTYLAQGIYAGVLCLALYRAPLRRLTERREFSHVLFAASVGLLVLWQIRAGLHPGLGFHLLGVTALTLVSGPAFAFIGVTLALVGVAINGAGFASLPLNALLVGGIPILTTLSLLRLARRFLPANFFIFVFVNAFFAGGLSMLLVVLATTGLLSLFSVYEAAWLVDNYLAYIPLIALPEAALNGMLMTLLVALKPGWVDSFDDGVYLKEG